MKRKLILVIFLAVLGGCSATGDDYIRGQIPAVINHPLFGNLTVFERELLGPDTNQNGIRDDIDVIISKISDEKKPSVVIYVQEITHGMIIGSRGVPSAACDKSFTVDVPSSLTDTEKNRYLEVVANTAARKAAFSAWQDIKK